MIWFVVVLQCLATYVEPDSIWNNTVKTDSGELNEFKFYAGKNNQLIVHGFNLNEKPHGRRTQWFPSGKLESIDNYKNGRWVDTSLGYYESGKPSGWTICDPNGDSCTWTAFFPDGRISGGGQSKHGVTVGLSWSKYADGKWQHITERDEEGRYHGARVRWDSLGRLIDSIVYFRDEILREWNWYPGSSQLEHRCVWDSTDQVTHKAKPRLMEAAFFAPDGKSRGSVVGGNGVRHYYYEGKLSGTETYKGGVMVRSTLKYLDDGSLNPLYAKKKKR